MQTINCVVILLLSIFCFFSGVKGDCAFVGAVAPAPPLKLNKTTKPHILVSTMEDNPCPYYNNSEACCTQIQLNQLSQNFVDIDYMFGESCDICAVNLKRMWCEFTCNPNQAEFIEAGKILHEEYNHKYFDALNVTFYHSTRTVCELYQSCEKVPEVTQMCSSGQGFLQFQGDHSIDRGNVVINFVFGDENTTINGYTPYSYEIAACDQTFPNDTFKNYTNITACKCDTCDAACNNTDYVITYPGYFHGFKWKIVVIIYVILIALIIGNHFLKKYCQKKKMQQKRDQKEEELFQSQNSINYGKKDD